MIISFWKDQRNNIFKYYFMNYHICRVEEMNDIIEQWLDMVYTKIQVHQVCLQKPTGKQKQIFQ
jgi:hypothetical protein